MTVVLFSTEILIPFGASYLTGWSTHDQVDAVRLGLGLVADTLNLERLGEPLRHAVHHVLDERPGESVQRLVPLVVTRPRDGKCAVGEGDLHLGMHLGGATPRGGPLPRRRGPRTSQGNALPAG